MNKENIEIAVHLGKENDEECHIKISGILDKEFYQELQELLFEHDYIKSL